MQDAESLGVELHMNFEGGRLEWRVREGIYDVDDATMLPSQWQHWSQAEQFHSLAKTACLERDCSAAAV